MASEPAGAIIELRILGRFVVLRDGAEVPAAAFGGRKVRALVRILVTRRDRIVPNDVLTELLWPDRAPADPAANLQVLVNRARRAVGRPDLVVTGSSGYALTSERWCVVDAERFLADVARAAELRGRIALDAYKLALAAGDAEPLTEDRYTGWAEPYRDEILRARQTAWERAASLALEVGDPGLAVAWAAAAARAEPLREVAVLTMVRALAATGDSVAALARYQAYRRQLADELGLDPSREAAELELELLGADPAPPRTVPAETIQVTFTPLRFVGRTRALEVIMNALAGSSDRRARVVRVAGGSGTGKSRLLAEVGQLVAATYVRAFWADRDEPWTLARALLAELVAADFAVANGLPGQLRAALTSVLPDIVPAAGPLGPLDPLDAESRRALVFEAAVRVASAIQGLVVIVDDLQWTDPSSLRLLAALVDRLPGLGLVVSYRPEEVVPEGEIDAFLHRLGPTPSIKLGRLSERALRDLADPGLAAALVQHTDRTAIAVTEVVRRLAGEGVIIADRHGRWRQVTLGAIERAAELGRLGQQQAIAHRVAGCAAPGRAILQLLALLGREAAARTLAEALATSEATALDALSELSALDLVHQSERGWGFAHDMVGEVVAATLGGANRARLEARLAAVLDQEDGDPAERARLWLAAGDRVRAAGAYASAAQGALEAFADAEAEQLADAGLSSVGSSSAFAAERSVLLQTRAQARRRRGAIAGARADLRAALDSQHAGPGRSRVLTELAILASGADDLERAAELAELALVEAGPDLAASARALEAASVIDMNLGQPDRAERRAGEALARYTKLSDSRGTARILDARAMATFLDGDIRTGTALLDRAANLFEDSGDLMRTVTPRSTRGHGLVLLDRADEGLVDATRALDFARALGHPEGQAYALWHQAEALSVLDRAIEAIAVGEEALAIATRIGHRGWTATSWRAIGLGRQAAGDYDLALEAFEQSLASAEHLDLFGCWAAARAALMNIILGRSDRAAPLVARALTLGPALGRHEARWAAAELAVASGQDDASRLVQEALAAAERGGALVYQTRLAPLAQRPAEPSTPTT